MSGRSDAGVGTGAASRARGDAQARRGAGCGRGCGRFVACFTRPVVCVRWRCVLRGQRGGHHHGAVEAGPTRLSGAALKLPAARSADRLVCRYGLPTLRTECHGPTTPMQIAHASASRQPRMHPNCIVLAQTMEEGRSAARCSSAGPLYTCAPDRRWLVAPARLWLLTEPLPAPSVPGVVVPGGEWEREPAVLTLGVHAYRPPLPESRDPHGI